jgi:transposase-like protein
VDKGRFLIETHLQTGRPIAELARAHGVHRSWLYKRLARYRTEGEAGFELRSRRPHTSPARIADLWEDEIVRLRKELGSSSRCSTSSMTTPASVSPPGPLSPLDPPMSSAPCTHRLPPGVTPRAS